MQLAMDRIFASLGRSWEIRNASFKPFPAAHVIHPYIDALLGLRRQHHIDPRQVRAIVCPVASYIVPIVCEPVGEKRRPQSDSHGRVSLQYTLAEALYFGRARKGCLPDQPRCKIPKSCVWPTWSPTAWTRVFRAPNASKARFR